MSVSDNIQRLRKERKLTQANLAKKANISEISIRKYESGDRAPKLETIRKIALALEVSVGDILPFEDGFKLWRQEKDEKRQKEEKQLLGNYKQLNEAGREEAQKRVQELTEIKRYTTHDYIPDFDSGIDEPPQD